MFLILGTFLLLQLVSSSSGIFQYSVPPIPFRSLSSSFPANTSQGSGHSWSLSRRQYTDPSAGSCDTGSFLCPNEASCYPNDKQCCGALCYGSAYYYDPTGPDLSRLACCPLDSIGGCDFGSNPCGTPGYVSCAHSASCCPEGFVCYVDSSNDLTCVPGDISPGSGTITTPDPSTSPPGPSTVPPDPSTVPPDPSTVPPDPSTVPPDPSTVPPDQSTVPPDPSTVPPDPSTVPPDQSTVPPDPSTHPAPLSTTSSSDPSTDPPPTSPQSSFTSPVPPSISSGSFLPSTDPAPESSSPLPPTSNSAIPTTDTLTSSFLDPQSQFLTTFTAASAAQTIPASSSSIETSSFFTTEATVPITRTVIVTSSSGTAVVIQLVTTVFPSIATFTTFANACAATASGSLNRDFNDVCIKLSDSSSLSPAAIGGIVAGAVALVLIIALLLFFCCRKKRNRREKRKRRQGGFVEADGKKQDMTQKEPAVLVDSTIVPVPGPLRREPILPYPRIRAIPELYKAINVPIGTGLIRVLYLQPGSFHESLACHMEAVPLGSGYNALSYSWGSDKPHLPLEVRAVQVIRGVKVVQAVQGVDFPITINLDSALRHLRQFSNGKVLPIWIDAICINQTKGNPEKGPQLLRMRDIYAQAQRTFIWLGPGNSDSDEVIKFLNNDGRVDWSERQLLDDYNSNRPFYDKFMSSIMQSTWFSRLWIVQELVMSHNPPVMCGGYTMPWPIISKVVRMIRSHHLYLNGPLTDMNQFFQLPAILEAHRTQSFRGEQPDLHYWLTAFRTQRNDVEHKEDRIFALLGLASDRNHVDLQPPALRHLLPPIRIFTQATKHAAITCYELDTVCIGRGPNRMPGLPSWVPDYSLHPIECGRPLTHISFAPNEGFSAGGCKRTVPPNSFVHYQRSASNLRYSPSSAQVCIEPAFDASCAGLVVDVIFIDTVAKTGRPYDPHLRDDDAWFEYNRTWGENTSTVVFGGEGWPTLTDAYPGTHERRKEALGRTLLCDRDANEKRLKAGEDFFSLFDPSKRDRQNRRWDIPQAVRQQILVGESLWIWRWLRNRKVFVTEEDGFMGMGPEEMTVGDHVVVVLGSGVPWVVREMEGADRYEFVGECYLDGVMDGEIVDDMVQAIRSTTRITIV